MFVKIFTKTIIYIYYIFVFLLFTFIVWTGFNRIRVRLNPEISVTTLMPNTTTAATITQIEDSTIISLLGTNSTNSSIIEEVNTTLKHMRINSHIVVDSSFYYKISKLYVSQGREIEPKFTGRSQA